ncbi:MAG: transglutaminase domain-containing protein [Planctomycetaceae bacterium]
MAVVFVSGLPTRLAESLPGGEMKIETSGWVLTAHGVPMEFGPVDFAVHVLPEEVWFPSRTRSPRDLQARWRSSYLQQTQYLPNDLLEQLSEWVANQPELRPQGVGDAALARQWEQWLSTSNQFSYSLSLGIEDGRLDPVVDFLRNTRTGHCEYFASALALLLRTQGISTRVVSGFQGGQVQPDGRIEVRDLHAHLWVEAYVEDAPVDPITGQRGPRWITLDPTPAAREDAVRTQQDQVKSFWGQLREDWLSFWNSSLRMSRGEQQALVYEPLSRIARNAWDGLREAFEQGNAGSLLRGLSSPRNWISGQGGLVVFFGLLALSGLAAVVMRVWRWSRRRAAAERRHGRLTPLIPFYHRLLAVLRSAGWERADVQTPREFMRGIAPNLAERQLAEPAEMPGLTERFYAARFGQHPIDADEAATLDEQVQAIEARLRSAESERS